MIKNTVIWVCLSVLMSVVSGCTFYRLMQSTKIENPSFEFLRCDLKKATDKYFNIECFVLAQNPNLIGLKNIYISYEIFVEDKRLINGREIYVELAPKGETELKVPASISYNDLLHALEPVLGRIFSNQKTIPITIKTRIYGQPTLYNGVEEGSLFSFERRLSKTIDVPMPEDEINRVKDSIRRLF
jgi:LEA14-like dessication related protein